MIRVAVLWLGPISTDTGGRTYFQELLGPLGAVSGLEVDVHIADSDFDVPETCRVFHHLVPRGFGAVPRIACEQTVAWRLSRSGYDVLLAPFSFIPWGWRGEAVVVQHNVLAGKGAASRELGLLRAWYRRHAVASSIRRATRVIAVSEYLRRLLLAWYPDLDPARVSTVLLAPPTRLLSATPNRALFPERKTVLVVGALWPHKGVDSAVEAFACVAKGQADLRLDIVGPGSPSARAQIVQLADSLGVGEQVRLLGNLSQSELANHYASANVLLFLSRVESFGLPVLEAMALGVPVVARRIEALIEIAGDAPLWVGADASPPEIARVLTNALENQSMRENAIRSGLMQARRLSWTEVAQATATILIQVAQDKRETGAAKQCVSG